MSTNSINKIYVNGATRMSLNDRFSVIQSVLPTNNHLPNQAIIGGQRKRSNSRGRVNGGVTKQASLANRKFLEQLEKKHKMRTALKLKRRSLKAAVPPAFRRGAPFGQGQRINNRFTGFGGRNRRGSIGGRLSRLNNFANMATMKADLIPSPVAARSRRSNSTSSLAARLGTLRRNSALDTRRSRIRGINQQIRGRSRSRQRNLPRSNSGANLNRSNSRSNLNRSNSRSNLNRSNIRANLNRSNSRSNLNRSNSRSNLNRSNSRNNLNSFNNAAQQFGRSRSASRNRQNLNNSGRGRIGGRGNGRFRSASQLRKNLRSNSSIQNRLGVKRQPLNINQNRNNFRGGRNIAQGRITKRKNSTGSINNVNLNSSGGRQGRTRGRGNSAAQVRSRSQSRGRNRSAQRGRQGNRRGRGGRNLGRGINRPSGGQREGIKKEDLDKELDQYMATTKTSDVEM